MLGSRQLASADGLRRCRRPRHPLFPFFILQQALQRYPAFHGRDRLEAGYLMTASLSPFPRFRAFDAGGLEGILYHLVSRSSSCHMTPTTQFADLSDQTQANEASILSLVACERTCLAPIACVTPAGRVQEANHQSKIEIECKWD